MVTFGHIWLTHRNKCGHYPAQTRPTDEIAIPQLIREMPRDADVAGRIQRFMTNALPEPRRSEGKGHDCR